MTASFIPFIRGKGYAVENAISISTEVKSLAHSNHNDVLRAKMSFDTIGEIGYTHEPPEPTPAQRRSMELVSGYSDTDNIWPLRDVVVERKPRIITFDNQFEKESDWDENDVKMLESIKSERYDGGPNCRTLNRFICLLKKPKGTLEPTARMILDSVGAVHFSSEHIATLDATEIASTGYNGYTRNDQIHTEVLDGGDLFFFNPDDCEEFDLDWIDDPNRFFPQDNATLRRYCDGDKLWRILIHTLKPRPTPYFDSIKYRGTDTILFAVGVKGDRLLGVVTTCLCHNTCD